MAKIWRAFISAYKRDAPSTHNGISEPKQTSSHRFASAKKMHSTNELPDTFQCLVKEGDTLTTSIYLSPLVTLAVGSESDTAKPTLFYVHQDKLMEIPFFVAALRPDAFIEGKERRISFPEEDPFVFTRLVEHVYEDNMFPRVEFRFLDDNTIELLKMERKPWIVRPSGEEAREYDFAIHESAVMCGLLVSTKETFKLFELVVQVMCLSDRYGYEALVDHCLDTLSFFPIGTREVALLAKHVLESISDSNVDVYRFLDSQIRLHRFRISSCAAFQALLDSDNPLVHQGLVKVLININCPGPESIPHITQRKYVICVLEVTIAGSIQAYGANQPRWLYNGNDIDGHTAGFGVALKGEVLLADGIIDDRGFFVGLNPRILNTPKSGDNPIHGLTYPANSFRWLTSHDRFL